MLYLHAAVCVFHLKEIDDLIKYSLELLNSVEIIAHCKPVLFIPETLNVSSLDFCMKCVWGFGHKYIALELSYVFLQAMSIHSTCN